MSSSLANRGAALASLLLLGAAPPAPAPAPAAWGQWSAWGDQGDGTYRNPVAPADYSDLDAIRVDDDYYAISSTIHVSPGMAVLRSRDLVNWRAIGHVVPDLSYWTVSGQLVLIAVLGGIGAVPGAFIGAFFLEIVRTLAVGAAAEVWNAIVGISLLIVIFLLPEGLYGLLHRLERVRGGSK